MRGGSSVDPYALSRHAFELVSTGGLLVLQLIDGHFEPTLTGCLYVALVIDDCFAVALSCGCDIIQIDGCFENSLVRGLFEKKLLLVGFSADNVGMVRVGDGKVSVVRGGQGSQDRNGRIFLFPHKITPLLIQPRWTHRNPSRENGYYRLAFCTAKKLFPPHSHHQTRHLSSLLQVRLCLELEGWDHE